MKVTIEFEHACESVGFGESALFSLITNTFEAMPFRPTIVVKVPAKVNGCWGDKDGAILSDLEFTVKPKR